MLSFSTLFEYDEYSDYGGGDSWWSRNKKKVLGWAGIAGALGTGAYLANKFGAPATATLQQLGTNVEAPVKKKPPKQVANNPQQNNNTAVGNFATTRGGTLVVPNRPERLMTIRREPPRGWYNTRYNTPYERRYPNNPYPYNYPNYYPY